MENSIGTGVIEILSYRQKWDFKRKSHAGWNKELYENNISYSKIWLGL